MTSPELHLGNVTTENVRTDLDDPAQGIKFAQMPVYNIIAAIAISRDAAPLHDPENCTTDKMKTDLDSRCEEEGRQARVVVLADQGHVRGRIVRDELLRHYVDKVINVSWFAEGLKSKKLLRRNGRDARCTIGLRLLQRNDYQAAETT